ncbi:uncharacterized protein SPSK_04700 [Sporothrix schenckii 1099-18]|uniref:Uncharacterized protein n=1 Tax=Sporothrix schenckii 1099-18 TaxID=1397361 RepID=A0A0F2M1V8_SPOSC|nr:uncharacterized protein SPSK_04700 [Sporothrix schenckii 1099-18]KJR83074.1 hypothetical protein SPSK_04700 [Sporothrix schenckii 1099-18]
MSDATSASLLLKHLKGRPAGKFTPTAYTLAADSLQNGGLSVSVSRTQRTSQPHTGQVELESTTWSQVTFVPEIEQEQTRTEENKEREGKHERELQRAA